MYLGFFLGIGESNTVFTEFSLKRNAVHPQSYTSGMLLSVFVWGMGSLILPPKSSEPANLAELQSRPKLKSGALRVTDEPTTVLGPTAQPTPEFLIGFFVTPVV